MIILSDCLTEKEDEGCLKVASSLARRLKERDSDTKVVSYGRFSEISDMHLKLNRFFFNFSFLYFVWKTKETVIYIPFASNTYGSAIRTFILSLAARGKVQVIFVLLHPMNKSARFFLEASRSEIIALSKDSYESYRSWVRNNAMYLKTGIDTSRFIPVNKERKVQLREKYHVAKDKKVLLHVGHLHAGRNIDKLTAVEERYHIFLVISSITEDIRDPVIEQKLKGRPDTTIIDIYLEHIEEIYQMADVYVFPVQKSENCIDVPLSVLEAASCNIPVVCTEYGELKEFKAEQGFCFLDSLDSVTLNKAIDQMAELQKCDNRKAVLEYDWNNSLSKLLKSEKWKQRGE